MSRYSEMARRSTLAVSADLRTLRAAAAGAVPTCSSRGGREVGRDDLTRSLFELLAFRRPVARAFPMRAKSSVGSETGAPHEWVDRLCSWTVPEGVLDTTTRSVRASFVEISRGFAEQAQVLRAVTVRANRLWWHPLLRRRAPHVGHSFLGRSVPRPVGSSLVPLYPKAGSTGRRSHDLGRREGRRRTSSSQPAGVDARGDDMITRSRSGPTRRYRWRRQEYQSDTLRKKMPSG